MAQKQIVVEGQTIAYEGIVDVNKVYSLMESWLNERGWDREDFTHEIKNREDYREIELELKPSKTVSDYVKFRMRIKVLFSKIKDLEVEMDGKKIKTQEGKVSITFMGYIESDVEGDFKSTPKFIILKTLKDKFIHKQSHDEYEAMLRRDVTTMRNEVSAYLNLNKYVN